MVIRFVYRMSRIFIEAGQNICFIKERDNYVFSSLATFRCLTFQGVSAFVANEDQRNR